MTSSLVGSEMCIRDRSITGVVVTLCRVVVHWASAKQSLTALSFCEAAVSYTHLTLPTICSV
eukprot:2513739-Prorocentrum_lima.AAC.1